MRATREIALAGAAAVLFAAVIVTALDWQPATATFPIVIGVTGLGLAICAVVADLRKPRDAAAGERALSPEERARTRGSFIWIGVFFAAVLLIGFEAGVSIAALAFYRIEARLGWTAAVIAAACCGGFLYAAAHVLSIPLYDGVLIDLFS